MSAYDTYMNLVKQSAENEQSNAYLTHAGVGAAVGGGAGAAALAQNAHDTHKAVNAVISNAKRYGQGDDMISLLTRQGNKTMEAGARRDLGRAGVYALGGAALGAAVGHFTSGSEKKQ